MSDKSTLQAVSERIRNGLGKINREAKAKAEGVNAAPQHDELDVDSAFDTSHQPGVDERLTAKDSDHNDVEDGFIIDGQAEAVKPKKKGLDAKQKALVIIAAVAVALWFTKQQNSAPVAEQTGAAEEQHLEGFKPGGDVSATDVAGPSFDLNDGSQASAPVAAAQSEGSEDELGFGGTAIKDAANDPIGSDALTADMNEQFGAPAEESDEVLDPFTGKVKTVTAPPADLPVQEKQSPATQANLPAAQHVSGTQSDDLAMIGALGDSPFSGGGSKSTELSGTKNQNPDSKKGVLQDQSANADVTDLKAKAAEKDSRIGKLETEVSKLKTELASTKHELDMAQRNPAKSNPSKAPQHKPVHAAHTNQRSTPSQRVASAPKAVPRPQVCVTAVAQAARNCTTCVPHAFITHRGTETMVGQGDFLDGLRVNIVGDRLDLQDAKGDVVHKFWSSPNGCAAG